MYTVVIVERMQIYLARGQRVRLDALARRRSQPVAQLVREAVDQYLAAESAGPPEHDALFDLVGADGGLELEADVSARHHERLADAAHGERASRGRPRSRKR
ncbi:hypothetical protein KGQ64_03490 [bacterium]|nr:hypothetical protein [bacterium]